jgi:hypothetical protein
MKCRISIATCPYLLHTTTDRGIERFPSAQRIQTSNREVSSWVGDDQRILSVVCFFPFFES